MNTMNTWFFFNFSFEICISIPFRFVFLLKSENSKMICYIDDNLFILWFCCNHIQIILCCRHTKCRYWKNVIRFRSNDTRKYVYRPFIIHLILFLFNQSSWRIYIFFRCYIIIFFSTLISFHLHNSTIVCQ